MPKNDVRWSKFEMIGTIGYFNFGISRSVFDSFYCNVDLSSIFGPSANLRHFLTKIPTEKIRHFKINPTTHHYPKLDFIKSSSFRLRRFQPIIEILDKIS